MAYHIGRTGMGRRAMQRVDREFTRNLEEREAYQRGAVRVISAGPNAFVYMVDSPDPVLVEQLEERFPGLASRISASRGVGFVLARSATEISSSTARLSSLAALRTLAPSLFPPQIPYLIT